MFALIVGAIMGWIVCLSCRVSGDFDTCNLVIFNIMVIAATTTYIMLLTSFVILRVRYKSIPRQYISPLGLPGAIIAILIWVLIL